MSSVSALPSELWLQILRSIYDVSLSSDISLQDYPWADNHRSWSCRESDTKRRKAMVRSISRVCRTWRLFAERLFYQEISLGSYAFPLHDLLAQHQESSDIFSETRRLNVRADWSNKARDLPLLVQSMPRLEWLQLNTYHFEELYFIGPWLPSLLGPGPQPCLLYLDLRPFRYSQTIFVVPESISLISGLATRLRRLTCPIRYIAGTDGQAYKAPVFEELQVLRLIDIRCDPGHEEAGRKWFSSWRLPSLKQFDIPKTWEYCTELLGRGIGDQIEVLGASEHCGIPEQIWFLCPHAHTVITSQSAIMPPEARPKLHYIFTYPFYEEVTVFAHKVLASLLTSLLSTWEAQGPANRKYTLSLQRTYLSWQSWAETCVPSFSPQVRSTLVRWKGFAEKYQMAVLDGCEVDIRDVAIPSEGLDESSCDT